MDRSKEVVIAGPLGHCGFGPREVDSLEERVAGDSRRHRFEKPLEESQVSPPYQIWHCGAADTL